MIGCYVIASSLALDYVSIPGLALFDQAAAAQTCPALALFVGDALGEAGKTVYAPALDGLVWVGYVGCCRADDAA